MSTPLSAAALAATLPRDLSPWGMFLAADPVVKAVMIGLVLASIATWTVGLEKAWALRVLRRQAQDGRQVIAASDSPDAAAAGLRHHAGPVAEMAREAAAELALSADALDKEGVKERVASRLERLEQAAARAVVSGAGILATIGATAPFIGLFGTVWGVMNSFIGISRAQTTNLSVVAPGIAEALLATALGLVAAIPAVVIYNVFARAVAGYKAQLGDAAAETLRLVSRDLDRRTHQGRPS